jgi:hypothetical protein
VDVAVPFRLMRGIGFPLNCAGPSFPGCPPADASENTARATEAPSPKQADLVNDNVLYVTLDLERG